MESQAQTSETGSPDCFQVDTDSTPLVGQDISNAETVAEKCQTFPGKFGIPSNAVGNPPTSTTCQQQHLDAFLNQQALPATGLTGFYMSPNVPTGQVMYVFPAQQQQPQQQHHVQLEPPSVIQEIPPKDTRFTCHVTLACFVFWLCGFLFGFVAYLLATKAQDNAANNHKKARILGRASLVLSVLGILSGATIVAVIIGVYYGNRPNPVTCQETEYIAGGECYKYKDSVEYSWECAYNYDPSYYDGTFCYFSCIERGLHYSSGADYCFKYKTPVEYLYSVNTCSSDYYGGMYDDEEFCFHDCPKSMYPADGSCYRHRSPSYVPEYECVSEQTAVYYDGTYCYSNCSEWSYFAAGHCFNLRSTGYNSTSSCGLTFNGLVHYDGQYCYHNCTAGSFSVAGKCFNSRSTDYNSAFNCSLAIEVGDFYFEFPYCYINIEPDYYDANDVDHELVHTDVIATDA